MSEGRVFSEGAAGRLLFVGRGLWGWRGSRLARPSRRGGSVRGLHHQVLISTLLLSCNNGTPPPSSTGWVTSNRIPKGCRTRAEPEKVACLAAGTVSSADLPHPGEPAYPWMLSHCTPPPLPSSPPQCPALPLGRRRRRSRDQALLCISTTHGLSSQQLLNMWHNHSSLSRWAFNYIIKLLKACTDSSLAFI